VEVKAEKVLERVYDWGRLRRAWKQVEKNAGAAGIDKMTASSRHLPIPTLMFLNDYTNRALELAFTY